MGVNSGGSGQRFDVRSGQATKARREERDDERAGQLQPGLVKV